MLQKIMPLVLRMFKLILFCILYIPYLIVSFLIAMIGGFLTAAIPKKYFGKKYGSKLPMILNIGRQVTQFWQLPYIFKLLASEDGKAILLEGSSWDAMSKISTGSLQLSAFGEGTIGNALMIHSDNGKIFIPQFNALQKFKVGSGAVNTIFRNAAAHYYFLHEIGHVLTQYRKDQTSEGFLLAFMTKNNGFLPYFWWTGWWGHLVGTIKYGKPIHWQYQEARQRAKKAKNILYTDWKALLANDIKNTRRDFNIIGAPTYNTHSKN